MRSHLCVYTFRDADGEVLYVGLSARIADRLARHSRRKDWWRDIATIDLVHCDDHAAMLATEARLIRELKPQFNVQGNRDRSCLPIDGWQVAEAIQDEHGTWTVSYEHPRANREAVSRGVRAATAEEAGDVGLRRWLSFAAAVNEERVR